MTFDFDRRLATRWALVLALVPLTAGAQDTDAILDEAARANPRVRAAHAQWDAASYRVETIGGLDDPRVTYGAFLAPVETRVGAQRHQIGVHQTFPWFGSTGRARDVQRSEVEAARQRWIATWLDVEFDVRRTLHAIHALDERLVLEREGLALLRQFESVARARLRVDAGTNADVLRLQVELGRTEDRIRALEDRREPAVAQLNALLDRAPHASLEGTPDLYAASVDSFDADAHPRVRALRAEARGRDRRTDVARDRGRPSITLGVVHTFVDERDVTGLAGNGDDATLATISVDLPLWRGRIAAGVRTAQRQRAAAEATARAAANDLRAAWAQARFDHDDAERRVELYRDTLLAKARESLRATLDAYSAGRADFGELIDVQRTLLEFERAELDARVDRANARAALASLAPSAASVDASLSLLEASR